MMKPARVRLMSRRHSSRVDDLPFTMPPSEAADCVKAFKPQIVYPYHFRGQKTEEFEAALKGSGIEVRVLNFYPAAQ